jgi:hypothetical protein
MADEETKKVEAAPVARTKREVPFNDLDFRQRMSDYRKRRGLLTRAYNAAKLAARRSPSYKKADHLLQAAAIVEQGAAQGIKVGGLVSADHLTQRVLREQAQDKANTEALNAHMRSKAGEVLDTPPTVEETRRAQAADAKAGLQATQTTPAPSVGKAALSVEAEDEEFADSAENPVGLEVAPASLPYFPGFGEDVNPFITPRETNPFHVNRSMLNRERIPI